MGICCNKESISANLQELERLVPGMVVLECNGLWSEVKVQQLMAGKSLQ